MVLKDYYKILDLKTSKVSIDEIKTAYRLAAKKHHPDVNVGDGMAEERIKDVNEAYRILSVPASKRKYDRVWNIHNVGKSSKTFNSKTEEGSIFKMFLGNIKGDMNSKNKENNIPVKGENIETEINTTIKEAFHGLEKKIALKDIDGQTKTFNVKIPEGILDGEKIRLIGQGKPGINGGKNGDLFIKININNDKNFRLKGSELYTDLLLTPWEAALGTKLNIEGISEETYIYIPKGIQSGEKIRVPGKGYKQSKNERGDLIAEIKVMVPKQLTKEEELIFKKFNEISKFNPRDSKITI